MGQDLHVREEETDMAMPKCLTATAVLLLSISGAIACDDYPEEMAVAAAQLAKAATAQQAPAAQLGAPAPSQPAVAAAAEPTLEQPQTTANLAGAVHR
jgi:hypothetical protein